jgi:cytoskeleton protein RodZ
MSDVETRGRSGSASSVAAAEPARERTAVRPDVASTHDEGSFGRALAAAREARGLSQSEVAAQLRLNLRRVRAIEEEDLGGLPEGPFVRGYVRNYAKLVDLPAEPLLALLGAKLRPSEPLRVGGDGAKAVSPIQRLPGEPRGGPLVLGGVVAVLVVLAVFGWWAMRADERQRAAAPAGPAADARIEPAEPARAEPPQAQQAVPVQGRAEPAAGAEPAPAAPDTALKLTFRDRSWVEVRQADGAVLLSQTNAAGTERTIDGVPPYTLVIGNASKVDLEFRGRPVDLSAATSRGDVARLRLE